MWVVDGCGSCLCHWAAVIMELFDLACCRSFSFYGVFLVITAAAFEMGNLVASMCCFCLVNPAERLLVWNKFEMWVVDERNQEETLISFLKLACCRRSFYGVVFLGSYGRGFRDGKLCSKNVLCVCPMNPHC